jgi:cupin fold WbuC family metalloprotein
MAFFAYLYKQSYKFDFQANLMKEINDTLLSQLSDKAKYAPRRRAIHCFHSGDADVMHRMLNALEPDTYVQPHLHPDKHEAFIVLRGRLLFVVFDEQGSLIDHRILEQTTGNFGLEIPPKTYHTLISLESGTVIFEIKHGPYDPLTDKTFATWSPKEGDSNCQEYNSNILKQIGLK